MTNGVRSTLSRNLFNERIADIMETRELFTSGILKNKTAVPSRLCLRRHADISDYSCLSHSFEIFAIRDRCGVPITRKLSMNVKLVD